MSSKKVNNFYLSLFCLILLNNSRVFLRQLNRILRVIQLKRPNRESTKVYFKDRTHEVANKNLSKLSLMEKQSV